MIFASFNYRLELFSFEPTYKEYRADRSRPALDFYYSYVYEGYPNYIYHDEYKSFTESHIRNLVKYNFEDTHPWRLQPFIGGYHIGETLSLVRNTFTFDSFLSPISFAFEVHGGLTFAHEGKIADLIGYDGVYFYGLGARISNYLTLRYGISHYCTHYGDGTYKQLRGWGEVPEFFNEWFKYLRMDALLFSISLEPIKGIRLFGELNYVPESCDTQPMAFSPAWAENGSPVGAPDSYKNRIIGLGYELEYPIFKNLGNTSLSYLFRAYEEGKVVYKEEDLDKNSATAPYFDDNRAWEKEHSLCLSQEINDLVSFDLTWHSGRFILNSYFATRSSYVSFAARLNFDKSIVLIDTAK